MNRFSKKAKIAKKFTEEQIQKWSAELITLLKTTIQDEAKSVTLISLFEKVYFYIFVMLIELVCVRVLSINLNQRDIGIHNNLAALQAPTECLVAAC